MRAYTAVFDAFAASLGDLPSVLEIPTLSRWGMAVLLTALAGLGLLILRRS